MARRAFVEIATELIGAVVPVLEDAGLVIEGAAAAASMGTVRFVVSEASGAVLPAECETVIATDLVSVTLVEERYGRQRIVRVGSAVVVPRASASRR